MMKTTLPSNLTKRTAATAAAMTLLFGLTACGGNDSEPVSTGQDAIILGDADGTSTSASPEPTTPASPSNGASDAPGAEPVAAGVRDDEAEIEVEDQRGNGDVVVIEGARVTTGQGLVVIQDPSSGEAIGMAVIPSGGVRDMRIALSTQIDTTRELIALLYADDGDGRFDPANDGRILDDDGDSESEDFDYIVE